MLSSHERIECQGQCMRCAIYTHDPNTGRVEVCKCYNWFFSGRSMKHLYFIIFVLIRFKVILVQCILLIILSFIEVIAT